MSITYAIYKTNQHWPTLGNIGRSEENFKQIDLRISISVIFLLIIYKSHDHEKV